MKPLRPFREPVIVSGMVASHVNQGGATWVVLQYVLGLREMGFDAYLVEAIPSNAVKPAGAPLNATENAAYFRCVADAFGLQRRSCMLAQPGAETVGLSYPELREVCGRAAALINISGMLHDQELIGNIPVRVYIDVDPGFNQLWHATQGIDMHFGAHNRFVTVGQSLAEAVSPIPDCGIEWTTTLPPVVFRYWPAGRPILHDGFTTIANWRGYGSIEHNGVVYGQKVHSLRPLIDLPTRTAENFILALSIHPDEQKDLAALEANGWRLADPACVAATPQQYVNFVAGSKAEFGIAKSGYVAARSAWFSDRSACYLACGRPVLAQETGFSSYLPCGEGLFRFRTAEEALDAIDSINRDYGRHSQAARDIGNEYFESGKVLSRLFTAVGLHS